jgi:hypothetical protein
MRPMTVLANIDFHHGRRGCQGLGVSRPAETCKRSRNVERHSHAGVRAGHKGFGLSTSMCGNRGLAFFSHWSRNLGPLRNGGYCLAGHESRIVIGTRCAVARSTCGWTFTASLLGDAWLRYA